MGSSASRGPELAKEKPDTPLRRSGEGADAEAVRRAGDLRGGASRVLPPSLLGRLRGRLEAFPARDWRRELKILRHFT